MFWRRGQLHSGKDVRHFWRLIWQNCVTVTRILCRLSSFVRVSERPDDQLAVVVVVVGPFELFGCGEDEQKELYANSAFVTYK